MRHPVGGGPTNASHPAPGFIGCDDYESYIALFFACRKYRPSPIENGIFVRQREDDLSLAKAPAEKRIISGSTSVAATRR